MGTGQGGKGAATTRWRFDLGDTIHGGGFRADTRCENGLTHLRLHFYVYPGESNCMVDIHKNQWLNPEEKKDALYLHNPELYEKQETSLNFTFFQAVMV